MYTHRVYFHLSLALPSPNNARGHPQSRSPSLVSSHVDLEIRTNMLMQFHRTHHIYARCFDIIERPKENMYEDIFRFIHAP